MYIYSYYTFWSIHTLFWSTHFIITHFFFCYRNLALFFLLLLSFAWTLTVHTVNFTEITRPHKIIPFTILKCFIEHHQISMDFFTSYRFVFCINVKMILCVCVCVWMLSHRLSSYSMQWNNVYKLIITQPIHNTSIIQYIKWMAMHAIANMQFNFIS